MSFLTKKGRKKRKAAKRKNLEKFANDVESKKLPIDDIIQGVETAVETVQDVAEFISEAKEDVDEIVEEVKDAVEDIKEVVEDVIDVVKDTKDDIVEIVEEVKETLEDAFDTAKETFDDVKASVMKEVKDKTDKEVISKEIKVREVVKSMDYTPMKTYNITIPFLGDQSVKNTIKFISEEDEEHVLLNIDVARDGAKRYAVTFSECNHGSWKMKRRLHLGKINKVTLKIKIQSNKIFATVNNKVKFTVKRICQESIETIDWTFDNITIV